MVYIIIISVVLFILFMMYLNRSAIFKYFAKLKDRPKLSKEVKKELKAFNPDKAKNGNSNVDKDNITMNESDLIYKNKPTPMEDYASDNGNGEEVLEKVSEQKAAVEESLATKIKNLPPEIKAIIFTHALDRKDDFFDD